MHSELSPTKSFFARQDRRGLSGRSLMALGLVTALIGAAMLLGRVLAIPLATNDHPGFFAITANGALGLLLTGTALWLFQKEGSRRTLTAARLMAAAVIALGALTLAEHLRGWDFGIDQLLFRDAASDSHGVLYHHGRMPPDTALAFIILGSALLLLRRSSATVGVLGLLVLVLGMNRVIAMASGPHLLGNSVGIAVPTTAVFLLIGGAFLMRGFQIRWALEKGITFVFAGAVIGLIAISMLNYRKADDLKTAVAWTRHTQRVLTHSHAVRVAADEIQAAASQYALTGRDEFLQAYAAALRELGPAQTKLRQLTADNPSQQTRIGTLDSQLAVRLAFDQRTIEASKTGGLQKAIEHLSSDQGEALAGQLRATLAELDGEEHRLGGIREAATAKVNQAIFLILPMGTLLSVVFLVVGLFRLNGEAIAAWEGEERFRILVGAVQDYAIYAMDIWGRIVSWNAGAQRIKGYSAEEIVGEHFSRFYLPEEIENGTPAQELEIAAAKGRFEAEGIRVRKDGTRFWASVTITALPDGNGGLRGFSKITRDISARKAAEENVRNAHRRAISELLESVTDGFVGFDRDWRYTHVNAAAARLSRKTPEELLGKVLWEVFPEAQARFGPQYRRAMDEHTVVRFEEFYPEPLNAWLDVRCYPSADGLKVFFADITERKNAQAALLEAKQSAEEANKAKDVFLATLSHELRTPLTPILLTASSLESDEKLPADLRAQCGVIRNNIELEARLIDDLLDLTTIAHGKFSVRRQNLTASDLLSAVVEMVGADYESKKIAVQVDAAASSTAVYADPARLQQVFGNLLKNAIKFTPAGGDIFVRTFNPDPRHLSIEIRDTGIGIAPEFLKELFNPFQQGAATGKAQFGGLGLGLAICKTIIEIHGGTIAVASAGPDTGATFTVQLPLCEGAGEVKPEPDAALKAPASPLRILLVEDHESTRTVLARLLRKDGHQVEAVGSCAAALKAMHSHLANEPFQALICDLGLPDGSGLDVVRELKAHTPCLAASVALSGFGSDDDLRKSAEAGFTTHLIKPANLKDLRQALAA